MVMLFFSCINAEGEYRDCMYGGPTLEAGLDVVNDVVRNGAQLTVVHLRYYESSTIQLPVEAFDGYPIGDSVGELEEEWNSTPQLTSRL
jgi:hypothetical protein